MHNIFCLCLTRLIYAYFILLKILHMILWQITTSGWNSKGSLAPLDGSGKRCRAECPAPPGGGGSDCRTDGAGITAGFTLLRMSFSQTAGSKYLSWCHSTIAFIKSLTDNKFLSCHFLIIYNKNINNIILIGLFIIWGLSPFFLL